MALGEPGIAAQKGGVRRWWGQDALVALRGVKTGEVSVAQGHMCQGAFERCETIAEIQTQVGKCFQTSCQFRAIARGHEAVRK